MVHLNFSGAYYFQVYGQPIVQGVLLVILWSAAFLLIKSIRQSNNEFPSRWRTVGGACTLLPCILSTAQWSLLISWSVLTVRMGAIPPRKNVRPSLLTPQDFTSEELQMIATDSTTITRVSFAACFNSTYFSTLPTNP
jgi:hypothetical protein